MNSHTLNPSRSHARPPRFGFRARMADLTDRFRSHDDEPGAPALDLQDHGDGMDITEAIAALEPLPPWSGASVTAGNPLPPLARMYVPRAPSEVIPLVPLTERAVIFDLIGGEARTARPCSHCGAPGRRTDFSWRYDALGGWSCPPCQMSPDWRSPLLPGLPSAASYDEDGGTYESGVIARSRLGTDPRCVRQRPDGRWTAAVLIGGRRKVLGSFGTKEEAEGVYGAILSAFAAAAGRRVAA